MLSSSVTVIVLLMSHAIQFPRVDTDDSNYYHRCFHRSDALTMRSPTLNYSYAERIIATHKPRRQQDHHISVYVVPCIDRGIALYLFLSSARSCGARRSALLHQVSPLLLVVCRGLSLCEGFARPLHDVVSTFLLRPDPFSLHFDCWFSELSVG